MALTLQRQVGYTGQLDGRVVETTAAVVEELGAAVVVDSKGALLAMQKQKEQPSLSLSKAITESGLQLHEG